MFLCSFMLLVMFFCTCILFKFQIIASGTLYAQPPPSFPAGLNFHFLKDSVPLCGSSYCWLQVAYCLMHVLLQICSFYSLMKIFSTQISSGKPSQRPSFWFEKLMMQYHIGFLAWSSSSTLKDFLVWWDRDVGTVAGTSRHSQVCSEGDCRKLKEKN